MTATAAVGRRDRAGRDRAASCRRSMRPRRRWRGSREHDPVLNAFTDVTAERARAKARAIDAGDRRRQDRRPARRRAVRGEEPVRRAGPCRPAPARRSIATSPPAARDATLIERLEAAGAVLVGALNMGEYAYDFTGENVHDGPSRNPHDPTRMTGGSSGGSGSAVGGGAGADRARLRHQRLDPRAVVVLRHFRPEADLWPAVARALVSVRREPRPSRPVRAQRRAISRWPMTRCRAPTPTMRPAPTRPAEPVTPLLARGHRRPADRDRRRLFPEERVPGGGRGGRARRQGARRDQHGRNSRGRARPRRGLCHHHDRRRRAASRSPAQARRTISIRRCATG